MGDRVILPLEDRLADRALSAMRANKEAVLEWASLSHKGEVQKDVETNHPHPAYLLVMLAPGAGPKGGINFYRSEGPVEEVVDGRVVRSYRNFPPPGVSVLAECANPEDGTCSKLLELVPGARFKICRTGELEGSPRKFELQWTGKGWEVFATPTRGPRRPRRVVL